MLLTIARALELADRQLLLLLVVEEAVTVTVPGVCLDITPNRQLKPQYLHQRLLGLKVSCRHDSHLFTTATLE